MRLKKFGFFRELGHGDPDGPKLRELRSSSAQPHEPQIVEYLRMGLLFIACPGIVCDCLKSDKAPIASPDILTDGVWAWPGDLPYYVEHYHVALPEDFVGHMSQSHFTIPKGIDVTQLSL